MAKKQALSAERVRKLAREGAESLLKRLRMEIAVIEKTFPELALPQRRRTLGRTLKNASKRAQKMSVAARKEASKRIKKYGVERRRALAPSKKK